MELKELALLEEGSAEELEEEATRFFARRAMLVSISSAVAESNSSILV
jgi:hypothetical protein